MKVYLFNIFLLIIWSVIILDNKGINNRKKLFCIFASFQWIVISGLRHLSIGADTYAYKVYSYDLIAYSRWSDLFNNFINIMLRGGQGKDPGYSIIEKFTQT